MADHVQVDLVTPEQEFASLEATMIEVPGAEGDFGVLPDHSPMISSIRPGVVRVYPVSGDVKRFLVMGGVSEVTGERCAVLAEYLEDVSDATVSTAEKRVAEAKKAYDQAVGDDEHRDTARKLEVAEALLAALTSA